MKIKNFNLKVTFCGLILASIAKADCYVDIDLSCSNAGEVNPQQQMFWQPRPLFYRTRLMESPDVQRSAANCMIFAEIMHHECKLKRPLQMRFTSKSAVDKNVFITNVGKDLFEQRSNLPKIFQDYLNLTSENFVTDSLALELTKWTASDNTQKIKDFLSEDSYKIQSILVPAFCTEDGVKKLNQNLGCGLKVECEIDQTIYSRYNSTLLQQGVKAGNAVSITKVGELYRDNNATADYNNSVKTWCTQEEMLKALLGGIKEMNLVSGEQTILAEPKVPVGFSAFGSMPIMDQMNGYSQGLTIQKYGKNLALPGICLATANSMVATGLMGLSPGVTLGTNNQQSAFNNSTPVGTAVVRNNGDKNITKKLRYRNYSTQIDEMMRVGGLKDHFPDQIRYFAENKFFNLPAFASSPPVLIRSLSGYSIFFESDYTQSKSIQDWAEKNYKTAIAQGSGLTLVAQSSHSGRTRYASTPVVGHAVAVQGFSGSNLIVNDPWGVVSHLSFGDYKYENAGQVKYTLTAEEVNACVKLKESQCTTDVSWCLNMLKSNPSPGPVDNMPWCKSSNNGLQMSAQCNAIGPCQPGNTIQIIVPNGSYRMMTHVGASPGYVGQTAESNSKTAAYIKGVFQAQPWQVNWSTMGYLMNHSRNDESVTPITMNDNLIVNTCTTLNIGTISVAGKKYKFRNPIPYETKWQKISSATPIKTGCMNFREVFASGQIDSNTTDMTGTMKVTCANGVISVVEQTCEPLKTDRTCQVDNGSGEYIPLLVQNLEGAGGFYYGGYSTTSCKNLKCNPGFRDAFDGRTQVPKCICDFLDSIYGARMDILGQVITGHTENGRCTFSATDCPVGTVMSPASNRENPSCVVPGMNPILDRYGNFATSPPDVKRIAWSVFSDQRKLPQSKWAYMIDKKRRPLSQIYDPEIEYVYDNSGFVEAKKCINPLKEISIRPDGEKFCEYTKATKGLIISIINSVLEE